MKDINLYNKVVSGEGENELRNIIMQSKEIIKIFNHYFDTENNTNKLTFNFSELYRYIFINKQEIGWEEVAIGNKKIEYAQSRKVLFDMLSFLNDFVIYQ